MKAELAVTDLARKILPDLSGSKRRHDSRIAAGAFGLRKRGTTGRLCAWQVKDIAAPRGLTRTEINPTSVPK